MPNGLKDVTIKELYTLEETIAASIFDEADYPWEVLPESCLGIKNQKRIKYQKWSRQ